MPTLRPRGALAAARVCAPLLSLLFALLARAEAEPLRCPVPPGAAPELGAYSAAARLRFLRSEVGHAAHTARAFAFSWGGAYAAQAAVGLAILPGKPGYDDRVNLSVSVASSLLGVATLLIAPPAALAAERRLARLVAAPAPDPCARLAAAERVLERAAASEAFSRGPLIHIGTAIYNIGLGVLLGFVFQHWSAAGTTVAVGMVVGTAMNIMKPSGSITALARYRAGRLAGPAAGPRPRLALLPEAGPGAAGIRLGFSF